MKNRTVVLGGLCTLLFLNACSTAPVTGRKELNLVSASDEAQLGLSSFEAMKKEIPISKDPQMNAAVQRVGMQIAKVAGPDMPDAQWEFVVFFLEGEFECLLLLVRVPQEFRWVVCLLLHLSSYFLVKVLEFQRAQGLPWVR